MRKAKKKQKRMRFELNRDTENISYSIGFFVVVVDVVLR